MQLSHNAEFWLNSRPESYVSKKEKRKSLLHFDMGECIRGKKSIPYPDPSQTQLKKCIANVERVQPDHIALGSGTDEFIETIPRLFINPGDEALVVVPTFFRFIDATLRVGGSVEIIRTHKKDNFAITEKVAEKIMSVLRKKNTIRVVWLCSPNNPTGLPIPIRVISRIAASTQALVVLDEVFANFLTEKTTIALTKHHDNLILLRSLSKLTGHAGVRIGFAIGCSKIIKLLEDFRLPFNIPLPCVHLVLSHMGKIQRDLPKTICEITKERERIFSAIQKMNTLELGARSQSTIFLLRHRTKNLFEELKRRHILTADLRHTMGLEKLNFVRITIQTKKQNDTLLAALRDIDREERR